MTAFTVWMTGLPCSGKSTLSARLAERLRERGHKVEVLDGDAVRKCFWPELGFSVEDRALNVRRLGAIAELLTQNGVITIVAAVSPERALRREVRERLPGFVEVFVSCPVAICEQRDVKGMYARARRGELRNFTGVEAEYEPPLDAEIVVRTETMDPDASVNAILARLEGNVL